MVKDLKDILVMTHNPLFNILRLSNKIYLLPSIVIFPYTFCNFKCEMCANRRNDIYNSKFKDKSKKIMKFELMKSILDQVNSINLFFKPRVHFSGYGEPLMYPYFKETIEYCKKKKLKWSVTTNGYFLDKFAEDLIKNNCSYVNISIHGEEKLHNSITQVKDAYKKVINGLKILNKYKKEYNTNKPIIAINCAISNKNVFYINEIIKKFSKLLINSITLQHLIFFRKDFENNVPFLIKDKKKLDYLKKCIVIKNKNKLKIRFFPSIKENNIYPYYTDINYDFKWNCLLPWLSTTVYPNGDIRACEYYFGNLHNEKLKDILNNKSYISLRKKVKKDMLGHQCERCCHREYS